jgi:ABC-type multidrug transport system ATPase subunit
MLAVMSIPPATSQVQGPAIHVQGLEKSYKELRVLRGVDFEAARGSIFALLGSNGAGKTTVVKILSTLSSGMRRRLDIAMSLIGNPPVIFLDEPTAGLDPQARIDVWRAVKELAEHGTTVLLTTQYLDEAEQLADRIAILHEGRIIVNGTLTELKQLIPPARVEYVEKQPTLEDVFLAIVGDHGKDGHASNDPAPALTSKEQR